MHKPTVPIRPWHLVFYRWILLLGLIGVLVLLGFYRREFIFWLITNWQRLLTLAGLAEHVQKLQQGLDSGIAKLPLPAVATYAAGYLTTCLLILYLVLPPSHWKLTLKLYALALGFYVLLTILAKLAGGMAWAYRLSRNLLDFVVSPLPVAGLYVLFRAGFGPVATNELVRPTNGPVPD